MATGMQFLTASLHGKVVGTPCHEQLPKEDDDEYVKIPALTAEKSQEAKQLLADREWERNPLTMPARVLRCAEADEMDDRKDPMLEAPCWVLAKGAMPIFTWFPQLDWKTVKHDLIAGITVGVMVIPQSMAYADIAGLNPIYGMYSACVPALVYALFGQSRQLAVGPVAMVSLLIEAGLRGKLTKEQCPEWYELGGADQDLQQYEVCEKQYAQLAILTAALVGVMQILARICQLGFLVSFLGHPVTSGFTSGAAIIIGISQLKGMLGFDIPKSQFVYVSVGNVVKNIGQTKIMCLGAGLVCLILLMAAKKASRMYKKISLLQPLAPLIICASALLIIWQSDAIREGIGEEKGYIGSIPAGLMPFSPLNWEGGLEWDTIVKVLPAAFSACLIGYMESIAIGKNLAAKHQYEIEAGQELSALGMANLIGAAFSSYPVTGSFSRSAVNNSVGALSPLSGIVTAVMMFFTLIVLTPFFYYLPKFALSAIVINSVIPLVAYKEAIKLFRIKKWDFVLWVVAFIGTLFLGVLIGIMLAVLLSLVIVIYESARPQITILWRIPGTTIYRNVKQETTGRFIPGVFIARIGSSLYFANASFVKDMLIRHVTDLQEVNKTEYIVLEMTAVTTLDSTAVHILEDIVNYFHRNGVQIAFAMVGNRVERTMKKARIDQLVGRHWFFPSVNVAVAHCIKDQKYRRRVRDHKRDVEAGEGDGHNPTAARVRGERKHSLGSCEVVLPDEASALPEDDEIGWSNELHDSLSALFINIVEDSHSVMNDVTSVLRANKVTIVRAHVEPNVTGSGGATHTYFVKDRHGLKLEDGDLKRIKEQLDSVLAARRKRHYAALMDMSPSLATLSALARGSPISRQDSFGDLGPLQQTQFSQMKALEQAVASEHETNMLILKQLVEQSRRLDNLMGTSDGCKLAEQTKQFDRGTARSMDADFGGELPFECPAVIGSSGDDDPPGGDVVLNVAAL